MRRSTRTVLLGALVFAVFLLSGCIPDLILDEISPDGRYLAQVLDYPVFDGPAHRLKFQGPDDARPWELLRLGQDTSSCGTIIWSADSSIVGFEVNGVSLISYDIRAGTLSEQRLVEDRNYPSRDVMRDVVIGSDGEIQFNVCGRRGTRSKNCEPRTAQLSDAEVIKTVDR